MKYSWKRGRLPPPVPGAETVHRIEIAVRERGPAITLVHDSTRHRLEAGLENRRSLVHVSSFPELLAHLATMPESVVLIAPSAIKVDETRSVGRVLASTARVVAVLDEDAQDPARLLELGARGVREVVDLRACNGWQGLRQILQEEADPIVGRIKAVMLPALREASPETRHFFAYLIRSARTVRTARTLSRRLGIVPSTFLSRFDRARLPSPRVLLCSVRLLFAKALLEDPRRSLATVAYQLQYSSPQSFGRHVRRMLQMALGELRRNMTFAELAEHFVEHLIVKHIRVYTTFDPLGSTVDLHTPASVKETPVQMKGAR